MSGEVLRWFTTLFPRRPQPTPEEEETMNWGAIIGAGLAAAEAIRGKGRGRDKQDAAATTITTGLVALIPDLPPESLAIPEVSDALRTHIDTGVALRNIILVKTGKDIFQP